VLVLVGVPRVDALARRVGVVEGDEVRELHPHAQAMAPVRSEHDRVPLLDRRGVGQQRQLGESGDLAVGGHCDDVEVPATDVARTALAVADARGVPLLEPPLDGPRRRIGRHALVGGRERVEELVGGLVLPGHEAVAVGCLLERCAEQPSELVAPPCDVHGAHPVQLAERIAARERESDRRRIGCDVGVALRRVEAGAGRVGRVDQVVGREHGGGAPRRARRLLGGGEQRRADARASPVGLDAQDLDVRRRGVVIEFPLHLDEADQPIGVERADRGVAREVGPAQVRQHLLGPASQVGGAQCLDVEAPQERGVGAQLGVIGRAGVVGESDRTDLDAHDRSSPGRRQPPRLARAQRRRQGSIGR